MAKKKALFTFEYGAENMKKIEDLGYEIIYCDESELEATPEVMDAEVIVCFNPFGKIDCTKMPNLKWIQLVSKGINHVPEAVRETGVSITYNANTTSIPIGECIVAYILQIFKDNKGFIRKQDQHIWSQNKGVLEVFGKTIGFIGTGRIAKEAAKRLKAFDAKIIGVARSSTSQEYFDEVYPNSELKTMLAQCDVVVSTVPSTAESFHMINDETIACMKDGVTLVNISRGNIIDTDALIRAIDNGKFRGVALDVYEQEPLPADHPLWDKENVIMTPHNVLWSDNYNMRCFETVYANCEKYMKGEALNDVADYAKGY